MKWYLLATFLNLRCKTTNEGEELVEKEWVESVSIGLVLIFCLPDGLYGTANNGISDSGFSLCFCLLLSIFPACLIHPIDYSLFQSQPTQLSHDTPRSSD